MFDVFLIVDKDENPSTEVPRNGTTSSYIENVITVEVNNKNQIHRYGYNCFHYILNNEQVVMFFKLFRKAIFWTVTIKAPMVITKQ